MDVEYTEGPEGSAKFETLDTGDTFHWTDDMGGSSVYLVTDTKSDNGEREAVDLADGCVYSFSTSNFVYPIDATVVVDGPEPE